MNKVYYEPKTNQALQLNKLFVVEDYFSKITEIESDTQLSDDEKQFLKLCATRLLVPKYSKIADYYTTASLSVKEWLEKLHMVIVDYDKAIQNGYFTFFDKYDEMIKEIVDE